jgi:sec-independent protein translocase protein TatA
MPGPTELLLILLIVLVVFGAGKIPQVGDALGKGIRNFKRAMGGQDTIDVTPEAPPREQLTPGSRDAEISDVGTGSKTGHHA